MKKLKLFIFGAGLLGASALGVSFFGSSEAEATNVQIDYCQWNGKDCSSPSVSNYCICDETPIIE